ncbi:hypothetical protein OC835_001323 [Tilletia horrida]|nr:hypothetical protein OC835_001323 [Tilletia horrida]
MSSTSISSASGLKEAMPNWPGIRAALALGCRPALALPHISVASIAHLDWRALKAAGVRAVVFDKDNCLARPHTFTIEPAIRASFASAIATFGLSHILIVSNSAGSSSDTDGIRAERLSRAFGGVPVLCHPQKKPGARCARMVVEHFEQVQNGALQIQAAEEGEGRLEEAPTGGLSWHKLGGGKSASRPFDGAIAVIGDRTLTDVVLAHRIGDELLHRRGRGSGCRGSSSLLSPFCSSSRPSSSATAAASSSTSTMGVANLLLAQPPPHLSALSLDRLASAKLPTPGIAILTSGIWAREGILNDLMRFIERRWVALLQKRGFEPGQRGWRPTGSRELATISSAPTSELPSKSRAKSLASRSTSGLVRFATELTQIGIRTPRTYEYQTRSLATAAGGPRPGGSPSQRVMSVGGGGAGQPSAPQPQWNYTRLLGALLGFFIFVPGGFYIGVVLKERNDRKALLASQREGEEQAEQLSEAEKVALEAARLKEEEARADSERRAKVKRLQAIKTEEYLMLQERRDVEEKIQRLRQRRESQ